MAVMSSSASSWQPVRKWSTIGVDSGTILFHIFINGLDDQPEGIFSKFAGEDGIDGNMPDDSEASSHKGLDKLSLAPTEISQCSEQKQHKILHLGHPK